MKVFVVALGVGKKLIFWNEKYTHQNNVRIVIKYIDNIFLTNNFGWLNYHL